MQPRRSQCLPSPQRGAATPANLFIFLVVLVLAWLLWSGIFKPVVLGLGVFSCLLTLFLARRMGFFAQSSELLSMIRRLPGYWLLLVKDIIVSSWNVTKIVLAPKLVIQPTMVDIDGAKLGEMGQTILGNSITLSPGTVTLDIDDGRLLVHCLLKKDAMALKQDDIVDRIKALES